MQVERLLNEYHALSGSNASGVKFTSISDDPEGRRLRKNHSTVSDDPEFLRLRKTQQQPSGGRYIAVYDYTAADDDEVSFQEGDVITNCEIIDDRWMTGTVERTGETGMLPSNYVEQY